MVLDYSFQELVAYQGIILDMSKNLSPDRWDMLDICLREDNREKDPGMLIPASIQRIRALMEKSEIIRKQIQAYKEGMERIKVIQYQSKTYRQSNPDILADSDPFLISLEQACTETVDKMPKIPPEVMEYDLSVTEDILAKTVNQSWVIESVLLQLPVLPDEERALHTAALIQANDSGEYCTLYREFAEKSETDKE